MTYLLTGEGWRQERDGYSRRGPGFIDNLLTKHPSVTGVHLPPDANTLLAVMDRLLDETCKVNVVVSGKHEAAQWRGVRETRGRPMARPGRSPCPLHCRRLRVALGLPHRGTEPELVLTCVGGIPTVDTLAAAQLLNRDLPDAAIRVVNIVDLCALTPRERHPHGIPDDRPLSAPSVCQTTCPRPDFYAWPPRSRP